MQSLHRTTRHSAGSYGCVEHKQIEGDEMIKFQIAICILAIIAATTMIWGKIERDNKPKINITNSIVDTISTPTNTFCIAANPDGTISANAANCVGDYCVKSQDTTLCSTTPWKILPKGEK